MRKLKHDHMRPAAVDINVCLHGVGPCQWMLEGTNIDAVDVVNEYVDPLRSLAETKARRVLAPLLQFLHARLEELLAVSVKPFGSHEYGLPLSNSDIDVQIKLVPGKSVKEGMQKLWNVVHSHTDLCTGLPKAMPENYDTLAFDFAGGAVDVRIIDCAQPDELKTTACLKEMLKAQPAAVRDALLLWKLLAHDGGLCHVHGQRKADNFKSITLVYFGVAVCNLLTPSIAAASAARTAADSYPQLPAFRKDCEDYVTRELEARTVILTNDGTHEELENAQ